MQLSETSKISLSQTKRQMLNEMIMALQNMYLQQEYNSFSVVVFYEKIKFVHTCKIIL